MSSTLKLDPKKTALVLIDLQNLIVSRNTSPYSAEEVMSRARTLADAFRSQGALVVYVHVLVNDLLRPPADEVMNMPGELPKNAMDIAPSAGMQPDDLLISKRHWGAFAQTNLEHELRSRGIEMIVLAGIATNIGVESTLRQGTGLGFGFVTVEDACSTFTADMQDFAFKTIFPRISHVRSTQQVLEALA